MENTLHPLLLRKEEDEQLVLKHRQTSSFVAEGDIQPIITTKDFFTEFLVESKKLWLLAGPAVFTSICQYSLAAVSQIMIGQVGTLELAAFSVQIMVVSGFTYGIMFGMGSALETLCGQAFGAGQLDMLGIYMQRSWIILFASALILTPFYIFTTPLLKLIGQEDAIAELAGKISLWMLPELFALAANFPLTKFLQAQSKMMAMSVISLVAMVLHVFLNWLLVLKLGWGLGGAVMVLIWSWWFITVAQFLYTISGACGEAWSGFSMKAFKNLWGFVKLSVASALMICLEIWYYTCLILFAGYLKNPELSVAGLSVCMNILTGTIMVAMGFNAAISVRVSNELGAVHPRTAKFSVVVVVVTSFIIGIILPLILTFTRNEYPYAFTRSPEVRKLVTDLTPLLAFSILINNVQPVISGVAIGAGWQVLVSYINIACYYLFGIPLGLVLGYMLDLGVKGIWFGMLTGTVVQTFILLGISYKTNWDKEDSNSNSGKGKKQRNCNSYNFDEAENRKSDDSEKNRKKGLEVAQNGSVYVRARRGEATDRHSLAERVRRERIREKLNLLQSLVPGCDKMCSKAQMLDEIISYVQSLQHHVEFLSMKLANTNLMINESGRDISSMANPEDNCDLLWGC